MSTPRNQGRVGVVGTLNVDLVWQVAALPRPGQTVLAHTTDRQFGGKGANQAVSAARQGARVTLVGAVGDDADGRAYREHLGREKIDATFVAAVPQAITGSAHVYVDARGENLIVVDQGANAHLDVARLSEILPRIDALLVQLECPLSAAVNALRSAASAGVRTVLNASPINAAFPWGEIALDTVIVNEHECAECFRHSPIELLALSPGALRVLLAGLKIQHLVVTRGAQSTLHLAGDSIEEVPTFRVVPRDTVGAGDMFAGALAAQLAENHPWSDALWHANVAAALSTLAVGAQTAMPARQVVEAAIQSEAGAP